MTEGEAARIDHAEYERSLHKSSDSDLIREFIRKMMDYLEDAETVEPKHGEWKINNNGWAYCSECESLGLESYNFCPYCGAKMKGADDE